jgi:uncharacterized cupin superfamily protein
MCQRRVLWLSVFFLCAFGPARAQVDTTPSADGERYAGTWSGTWDGAGTGKFVLTLRKSTAGTVTGKVDVVTDAGNYTAELKALAFDGREMSASYDFPLDPGSEVVLAATFDGSTAKGSWSRRVKGDSGVFAEGARGIWTVTRRKDGAPPSLFGGD